MSLTLAQQCRGFFSREAWIGFENRGEQMFVAFSINAEGGDQHQVIADVQPVEYRALFLHSIVERLLRGLRRDYWRSLWTRSRDGKGLGWQFLRSL